MNFNRRREIRKVLDKFAFIQLERDDGGAVLNVSEAGLSFNTFAPVLKDGPMRFWFSLDLRDRIEAWGEVTWMDAARKTGGLRFIHLSEEARRQIRKFTSRPSPREAPDEEFLHRVEASGTPGGNGASEPDAVARFVAKARPRHATLLFNTESAEDSSTLFPVTRRMEASGELVPMQRYLAARRRQLILGLLLGTCISAVVAASAIRFSNYHHKDRDSGKTPAELFAQKRGGEALLPVPMGSSAANGGPADIFSIGKQKKMAARDSTPGNLVAANAVHRGLRSSDAIESSRSAPTVQEPLGDGSVSQQKTSKTPEQLWASVQTGNTTAAVALADLYIKGEGVPQSCAQARVLLLVASEKRNAGAIKKLQELDKTGCPTI